jgi:arsenate reductase (thioredoxin)
VSSKDKVLVLCTGNSCRSQMAEGYLRKFADGWFDVHSAGMAPKNHVHPMAVEVMAEDDVDISDQHPKDVAEFLGRMRPRYLIIVCDKANATCPTIFPGMVERLYWPFDDPDAFQGSEADTLNEFRRVRDEIKSKIKSWLAELECDENPS